MAAPTPIQDAVPFLTDAAHLLRATAPQTSAHLMRHCTGLLQSNALPVPETHFQHSCGTCGHIMIPGNDGSSIRLQRAGSRTKRSRRPSASAKGETSASAAANTLRKQISCGRCGRTNSIKLGNASKAVRLRQAKVKGAIESAATVVNEATSLKNKSNTNSKKRAKNRKAGLESLLAAGQTQKSKSLSLSDFMR